jgi:hypothetical protein
MDMAGHGMATSAGPGDPSGASGGSGGVDNTARWLGGIGLILGALGLGLGGGAVLKGRRGGQGN